MLGAPILSPGPLIATVWTAIPAGEQPHSICKGSETLSDGHSLNRVTPGLMVCATEHG